jgi:TolB-like protein/class 3 adenylate cyclase
MPSVRRLTAILAADVAGYSRLMGADEEGTHERLKAHLRELVEPKIAEHRGRIVKNTGDGLLAEFASVVDAARCAVEIQRDMADREPEVPEERRIRFRIGINLGDVIAEPNDIYGNGVNIAARLEGLAEPGGICISRVVRDQIRDRLDYLFEDMGEQQVKNIARPVRVYRVRHQAIPSEQPASVSRQPLPVPDKPSLAVLPFQNMTGDAEQDYFVDGIVEEITTAISRLPWLFVISRSSCFTYKGQAVDVKQVARELGVRYVLEGSVRKAANRVRITGQLIDTSTGAHIWADRFDGALDDIFELQDQVASHVVGAIEPKLRQSEIERAAHKPTNSLDAYDLYLRASAVVRNLTAERVTEAARLCAQALELDPTYAPAAGLAAWCRVVQKVQGWIPPAGPEYVEGIELARRAVELGSDDPDTLWMAAHALAYLGAENATGMSLVDRALALNPNSAHAWGVKGLIASWGGQSDTAIDALQRAMRLSPLDPRNFHNRFEIGLSLLGARRYEEALEWVDQSLREQPRFAAAVRVKLSLCGHLGRAEEGRRCLMRLMELQPGLTIATFTAHAQTFLSPAVTEIFVEGLRKAGLPEE